MRRLRASRGVLPRSLSYVDEARAASRASGVILYFSLDEQCPTKDKEIAVK